MNVHEASKILKDQVQGIEIKYYYKIGNCIVFEVTYPDIPFSEIVTTNATYYAVYGDGSVRVVTPFIFNLSKYEKHKYS